MLGKKKGGVVMGLDKGNLIKGKRKRKKKYKTSKDLCRSTEKNIYILYFPPTSGVLPRAGKWGLNIRSCCLGGQMSS